MSTGRASSGGVSSLRAMFEKQEPSSPQIRGRSPVGSSSNGDGSRPLSKVRTSFVPVDPVKKRNDTPEAAPSTSQRRESFSLNEGRPEDVEALEEIKKTVSQELEARRASEHVQETVPEQAIETEAPPTPQSLPQSHLEPLIGGQPVSLALPSSDPFTSNKSTRETNGTNHKPRAEQPVTKPNGFGTSDEPSGFSPIVNEPPPNAESVPSPPPQQVLQNLAENLRTAQPVVRTPHRLHRDRPDEKSPLPPTPTPAPKHHHDPRSAPTLQVLSPQNKKIPLTNHTSLKTPTIEPSTTPTPESQTSPTTASADFPPIARRQPHTRGERLNGTKSSTGFVKPRPRSPTRPVRLPAHLVAPTASSAAKHGNTPPQVKKTLSRRSSTVSERSAVGRTSQILASRRSSARPLTQMNRSDHTTRVPDESFLARMMRPTASSASKVKDNPRPKLNGAAKQTEKGKGRLSEPVQEDG